MKQTISIFFSNQKNRNIVGVTIGVIVLSLISIIPFSLAAPTPIGSVEIKSEELDYDQKAPGSFKITKSAKWISKGKAQITFDVDTVVKTANQYTDIIFVLDISGSMSGNKLNRVKTDATELVNSLLSNTNNRAALITFETTSQIVSNLTNNKDELVNKINELQVAGCTNYYQALVNVDNILKNYQKENGREVIVLFLTDGYPNEDVPNEESQYRYLKEQYPYMIINGIQYEMGSDILDPIKRISDNQYIADMETLNNVLFDASVAPISYDNFNITDYIDSKYFDISSIDDITVSQGKADLNNNKIDWSIDNLKSGTNAKMTIEVNLKDEYLNKGGIYPTNEKEVITSTIDENNENITSTLTPILADNYQVIYDGNAPDGCTVENLPTSQKQSVFNTVRITDTQPECAGYKFKGWKVVNTNVKTVNNEYFIMPEENVTIRAEWSKLSITKSMDGKISTVENLYNMMARNSKLDTNVDFSKEPTTGIYELSSTKDDEFPVYYYRGAVTNNNVMFANFCWKIVRTTGTGGVKLIYNGVPSGDGTCSNTGTASQIGTSAFNLSSYTSPADVGYMYGTRYTSSSKSMSSSSGFVYGNDVTYENGVYTLTDTMTSTGWSSDYKTIATKYHYTCFTTGNTCSSVYYIYNFGSSRTAYYLTLSGGKNIEDAKSEMFTNTTNSRVKNTIDTWYQNNMTAYTDYLEDTVWCNDRSILSGPLKGKDEDSSRNTYTYFSARGRNLVSPYKPSVICPNINDSFTVSSSNGNGALTYPVALLTADEATLAGQGSRGYSSSSYLFTGQWWWALSPYYFDFRNASEFIVNLNLGNGKVNNSSGVRPSVSLKPGTTPFDGDGTVNNPYIIK